MQGWTLFVGRGGPVNSKGGNSETTTEYLATEAFHDQVPCIGTGEITITYTKLITPLRKPAASTPCSPRREPSR
jgi:hypothetical protein